MAAKGMHLIKSGKIGSWNCTTACGNRRAILAGDYATFMADGVLRCQKCAASKTAAFMARRQTQATAS